MKKGKPKKFTKHVRGFSVSALGFGGGVSFEQPPEEREIILKLLTQLADRRILFHHSCKVVHQDMIASLQRMRDKITAALEQFPESPATSDLTRMRSVCHDFQSVVEAYFEDPLEPLQADFHIGLRELKETLGECISRLSIRYDIKVEGDLTTILPKESDLTRLLQRSAKSRAR